MNWPTSQEYNEAIQHAATSFADPELKSGEVVVNAIGLPVPRSGSFADVYQVKGASGKSWAVKCFTRKVAGLQERYAKIDEHLSKANFKFTVGFQYLNKGILVQGKWFPILKMEWVEGYTLNEFVRDNAGKPHYLHKLMELWAKLTAKLRDANFAHADLQHGNVLMVQASAKGKLGLRLIDYDGMWVPALAATHSGEVGHPNYQHPLRLRDRLYNADVDRFAHLVIASALRATLIGGKPLWDRFDNGDNLLFKETDLRDPARSNVFKALWSLNDDVLCTMVGKLALASEEPLRSTPWLDQLLFMPGGPRLTNDEEQRVMRMLGVPPHFTASTAEVAALAATTPPAIVKQEFNVFATLDDEGEGDARLSNFGDDPDSSYVRRTYRKAPRSNSSLPLIVGGGIAALALIVGFILVLGGNKQQTKQEVVKDEEKTERPIPDFVKKKDPPEVKVDESKEVKKEDPKEIKKKEPKETKKEDLAVKDPLVGTSKFSEPIIGIAGAPDAKEYFVILENNPVLYLKPLEHVSPTPIGKHDKPVRALACAPDGATVVTGSDDCTVRVWSPKSNEPLHTLREHEKPVVACAVSRDGNRAVSIGEDDLLCEWDIKEGKLIRKFAVPGAQMIAFLPDGKSVLIGTKNESASVWHLEGKKKTVDLLGHAGTVRAACVTGDGRLGFTGGDDSIIRKWNLQTGQNLGLLDHHKGGVTALALSSDDRLLASGGADQLLVFWDVRSGSRAAEQSGLRGMQALLFRDGGHYLVQASGANNEGSLRSTQVNVTGLEVAKKEPMIDKKPIVDKKEPKETAAKIVPVWKIDEAVMPLGLAITANGSRIFLSSGSPPEVRVVSGAKGEPLGKFPTFEGAVQSLTVGPDDLLIVQDAKGTPIVVDVKDRKERYRFNVTSSPMLLPINTVDGKVLLPDRQGGYSTFFLKDGKPVSKSQLKTQLPLLGFSCTADGKVFAGVTGAPEIVVQPPKAPMHVLKHPFVRAVAMAPDGKHILGWGIKSDLAILDSETGKDAKILKGHASIVADAAWTPDGQRILSVSSDATLRLWDAASGNQLEEIELPGAGKCVRISADGRFAATATQNPDAVQLWRLPTTVP